ncbi:hypothetical protein NECAME_12464 [Necator americanus]|uniref:Tc1-like transposase DDE domain-containing protein n=1 Tax=Necator americanus TaxID=51031 RepID=W2T003_NECAM|nr:hypothetical protein NECAME_12464 [Necator americanus]ETN75325.1 hypothetical protein NECAME_12464 [Necator americanus]
MQKALHLTEFHKQARSEFARKNMGTQWDKVGFSGNIDDVIFTDEKKFNLDGPVGYLDYRRDMHKAPLTFSYRNSGGGSLMKWVGFCSSGKLHFRLTDGYPRVPSCAAVLLPFLRGRRLPTHVLQQENAAVHVARSTNDWLQQNHIQTKNLFENEELTIFDYEESNETISVQQ